MIQLSKTFFSSFPSQSILLLVSTYVNESIYNISHAGEKRFSWWPSFWGFPTYSSRI